MSYTGYAAQVVQDPTAPTHPSQPGDPAGDEEPGAPGSLARDCGDFADRCQSGFTFFRRTTTTRSTADQFDTAHEWIYLTFDASRGPILPTGTTYGVE